MVKVFEEVKEEGLLAHEHVATHVRGGVAVGETEGREVCVHCCALLWRELKTNSIPGLYQPHLLALVYYEPPRIRSRD
jgi:hypothetical protein